MKKISTLLATLSLVALMFNSCGDYTPPEKNMIVNGQKYNLTIATLDDYGTNINDLTYRKYGLTFKSTDINPENYISFILYSTSTTQLEVGTYTYSISGDEAGTISWNEVGINLQYDASDVVVAGKYMDDFNSTFEGTVTVSMKNDNYDFIFDLTIDNDGTTYHIQGEYNDALQQY
jgi:hypothetical protein